MLTLPSTISLFKVTFTHQKTRIEPHTVFCSSAVNFTLKVVCHRWSWPTISFLVSVKHFLSYYTIVHKHIRANSVVTDYNSRTNDADNKLGVYLSFLVFCVMSTKQLQSQ